MPGRAKVTWFFSIISGTSSIDDVNPGFNARFVDPVLTPVDADVDDLVQRAADWWNLGGGGQPAGKTLYSAGIVLARVTGTAYIAGVPQPGRELTVGVAGTRAAPIAQLPPQVCVGWSLRTAVTSRQGKGRIYHVAPDAGVVTGHGFLTAGYHDEHRDSANGFKTLVDAAAAWNLCVHSDVGGGAGTDRDVTDILVGSRVDTQRKRLPRVESYLT